MREALEFFYVRDWKSRKFAILLLVALALASAQIYTQSQIIKEQAWEIDFLVKTSRGLK